MRFINGRKKRALIAGSVALLTLTGWSVPKIEVVHDVDRGVVIAAAGDIACDPSSRYFNGGDGVPGNCQQKATAAIIQNLDPDAVLTLGDNQYSDGALSKFQASFDPSWGSFIDRIYPAPGNHDYATATAAGYFDYFGEAAGDRARGYYSFRLGAWHIVSLNSNCASVGGCGVGSPQERWLKKDLNVVDASCILAYWHHPRFSSGLHGSDSATASLWNDLYDAGADVILVGHDHHYERFAPQTPDGTADPQSGIREFIVGTGGKELYPIGTPIANSEVRWNGSFGVLSMTLKARSYSWRFISDPTAAFKDSGTGQCGRPKIRLLQGTVERPQRWPQVLASNLSI